MIKIAKTHTKLKFAAKIIVCCQLCNYFVTERNKVNFVFLKGGKS